MSVIIGSARVDENGNYSGGKSGDQTGKEVSTQEWYLHSKGWNVMRAKDSGRARKIAGAMSAACKNSNIGYSQSTRYEAYDWCKEKGLYNPELITDKVNTDCSALVRLCLAFADIFVEDFYTGNEYDVLMSTGYFLDVTSTAGRNPDYLKAGDILVTKTKGHTVIVLTNGSKVQQILDDINCIKVEVNMAQTYKLRTIEIVEGKGMSGGDVLLVQEILTARGYKGKNGKPLVLDGDTGNNYEESNTMFAIGNYIDDRNKQGANLGDRKGWGPKCWGDMNFPLAEV